MGRLKGLIYALISSSTFGLIPLFVIPTIREGMDLDSVLVYRFGLSTVLVGLILWKKGINLRVSMKELSALSVLGTLYALTAFFLSQSYFYIPSGVATTIHFLYPVLVALIMILFFGEKASKPIIFATILAIGGVYLLGSSDASGELSVKGLALALTTVVLYAGYIVGVNKSCVKGMDGLKMTFYVLVVCTVICFINLLFKGESLESIPSVSAGVYILLLALLPTLISDLTLILAIQKIGSTTTSILGCLEPLTAVSMGVLFLGETCGLMQIVGILTILTTVTIVILANNPKEFKQGLSFITVWLPLKKHNH